MCLKNSDLSSHFGMVCSFAPHLERSFFLGRIIIRGKIAQGSLLSRTLIGINRLMQELNKIVLSYNLVVSD